MRKFLFVVLHLVFISDVWAVCQPTTNVLQNRSAPDHNEYLYARSYNGKTVKIYANRSGDPWEIPYGRILLGYNLQVVSQDCLVLGPRGFCITEA